MKTKASATLVIATLAVALFGIAQSAYASKEKPVIGFSIDDLRVERWTRDRDYFIEAAKKLGAEVIVQSADGDISKQTNQIENLIAKKVDAIVIVPKESLGLANVLKEAKKEGIKIVAYDRSLINSNVDVFVSFDNFRVGEMGAASVLKSVPKGNYYVLGGSPDDGNAKLLKAGAMKALEPAVKNGDVKIVGTQDVKDWLPSNALSITENILTQFNDKIDAIIAPNDGTAGGAIQALAARKLAGKVAICGQDADLAAVKRVMEGTQTMTVYKSLRLIAGTAAKTAVDLVNGKSIKYNDQKAEGGISQILLDPVVIDKTNVNILVNEGFYTKEQLGIK